VMWNYVMDPNIGPFSRIKRKSTRIIKDD
jgi:hypothetical protein